MPENNEGPQIFGSDAFKSKNDNNEHRMNDGDYVVVAEEKPDGGLHVGVKGFSKGKNLTENMSRAYKTAVEEREKYSGDKNK